MNKEIEKILNIFNTQRFFIIIFSLGAIGHTISLTKDFFLFLTPLVLIFSSILLIYKMRLHPTIIAILIMISILGYVTEVVGVLTGFPFGSYSYGDSLGYKILDVPVVIAINWATIIFTSYIFAQQIINKIKSNLIILTPLLTAIIATTFDYIMEPVAIYLNYWNWSGTIVPTSNYITWFVFSLISSIFIYIATNGSMFKEYKIAISFFIAQLIFFTILNIYIL